MIEQRRDLPEIFYIELDLAALLEMPPRASVMEELSKFPEVARDFALVQDASAPFALIEDALLELVAEDALLSEVHRGMRVFDVYQGDRIEQGQRSVALQVRFRASDRTLTDEEISALGQRIISTLEERAGVKLRG